MLGVATIGLQGLSGPAGCVPSLPSLMTCAHTQEVQRHLPLALPISFQDEWGRLLARLTCPVFAQVADDGQRCVVVQVKREWVGLVLLGCGFRVHVYWVRARCQLDRARSWESSGPQTIAATYLRRGDGQMQKAPEHCCYRALETPPPAVGQAMNDTVSRNMARLCTTLSSGASSGPKIISNPALWSHATACA